MDFSTEFTEFIANQDIYDGELLHAFLEGREIGKIGIERTPAIMLLMIGCKICYDKLRKAGSVDKTGKKQIVARLFVAGNTLHERLHRETRVRMHAPLFVRTLLDVPSLLKSAERESREFEASTLEVAAAIREDFSEILSARHIPVLSDAEYRKGVLNENYITERPRTVCQRCNTSVIPVLQPEKWDRHNGYAFACPQCGVEMGYGGKLRPLLDNNGKRIMGTNFSAIKTSLAHCQLCGRSAAQVEALGGQLECHHAVPVCEGGRDEPSNITVLCSWCHKEAHKRRDFLSKNGLLTTRRKDLLDMMYGRNF